MTAPELVSVIAKVIADNSITFNDSRGYGELTASTLTPDEMARAVLAALGEAGNVEWASQNDGWPSVFRCDSREAADKETARFPYLRTTVSRITGPWTAVASKWESEYKDSALNWELMEGVDAGLLIGLNQAAEEARTAITEALG